MKIATAAYPLDLLPDWAAYEAKLTAWVAEAAAAGARLLVFPEYAGMELAGLAGPKAAGDLAASLAAAADRLQASAALHDRLARDHGLFILAGSGPARAHGGFVNRAGLFGPGGPLGHQDKQIMTMFERAEWQVAPGDPLRLFDIDGLIAGVTICYDAEFPLLGRRLAEAGAGLLLCPSCTETRAGYWRVRIGAMARALENQCVSVISPIVGDAGWCAGVEAGHGAAAIFGPPDLGFPETGVIAEGDEDRPGWVYGTIDPGAIRRVRAEGCVRNHAHWPEQARRVEMAAVHGPDAKNT